MERVWIVERLVDGPSERAERIVRKEWPDAEVLHGSPKKGEGFYGTIQNWKDGWPTMRHTLTAVVCARRTLALGGTVEVEDALILDVPVYTVHGWKLMPVTGLWYMEKACLKQCLGYGHRTRLHFDPQKVAETRHGEGVHVHAMALYQPRLEQRNA